MKIHKLLICITLAYCCSSENVEKHQIKEEDVYLNNQDITEVKIDVLKFSDFNAEIISNGIVSAINKADLVFRSSDKIVKIFVKNGETVKKGQIIAELDNFTLRNLFYQNKEQFERAKLDLQDILIGQGYSTGDTSKIPTETFAASKIKSGYARAFYSMKMAEYNLDNSSLRTPLNGLVANLTQKENSISNINEVFCTIIDNTRFEVNFFVLESELPSIRIKSEVLIYPYADENKILKGQIVTINPVINSNGMIAVTAEVENSNILTDGMKAKVTVISKVAHQLLIPKQALILRNDKQIVFTLEHGLAKWNYVRTGLENSTSFTIEEGLIPGDTIITEGNLNLAHLSKVKILR